MQITNLAASTGPFTTVPWDGVNTPPLGKYAIVRKTKFTNALLEISDKISRYYTSYEQLHSLRVDVVKWNP